jgi:hypothetical protein
MWDFIDVVDLGQSLSTVFSGAHSVAVTGFFFNQVRFKILEFGSKSDESPVRLDFHGLSW